jgi:hypothetical protein
MSPRAKEEWRRRTLCNGWTFYFWAFSFTAGMVVLVYLTARQGLEPILQDPWMVLGLGFCSIMLIEFWRARPRKKKPDQGIRLNLQ